MGLALVSGTISMLRERTDVSVRNEAIQTQVSSHFRIGNRPANLAGTFNLSVGDVVTAAGKDSAEFQVLAAGGPRRLTVGPHVTQEIEHRARDSRCQGRAPVNDRTYLGEHVNGPLANVLGTGYLVVVVVASLAAIPLMVLTGAGQ